ncbi:DMT family transporter [Spirosoma montaniterrae]|uniref:DMT family transporter n=1 Tax=Spirosoma montaniterrae TaxID=1178516 RepID=UPI003002F836
MANPGSDGSNHRPLLAWVLLCTLAVVWGSSFILMKLSLQIFTSEQVAAGRIMLAWLFFLPLIGYQARQPAVRETVRSRWVYLLIAGLLGNLLPAFLFAIAGAHLNSSLAGALNSLSPLFTLLIGAAFFGGSIRARQLTGVLLGLAGSVLLIFFSATGAFSVNGYALLIALATLCYGLNINLIGKYLSHLPPLVSSGWIFALIGPIALAALLLTPYNPAIWQAEHRWSLLALLVLGVFGSGVMTVLFNRVVQLTSPVFAASVTYLMPIVSLGWGFVAGEIIYLPQYIGMGICLLGVWLSNRR